MWGIYRREINSFFHTPLGYTLLGTFAVLNGLLLWVFPSNFNILEAGFGDINLFFELNPWLFIFLIPALGMKSFSEEIKLGTLALLLSKPIGNTSIILGKYFALLTLVIISLGFSLIYLLLLRNNLMPLHVIDYGVYIGSLTGLFLLAMAFAAISLWASTLIDSSFSAFLIAVFICLFNFYGWQQVAFFFDDFAVYNFIKSISLQYHYGELSKGIIRMSNVFYTLGLASFFLYWTNLNLKKRAQ